MNMITKKRKTFGKEKEMDDEKRRGKVLLWDLLVNNNDDIVSNIFFRD